MQSGPMQFEGCFTALVTPFCQSGVDFDALTRLIEGQIEGGINGLVPCGTTGECPTLSPSAWASVIEHTVRVSDGRVPVVAGCGSNNTQQTIYDAQRAQALGVDGLLVVAPYYSRPEQEGLYLHFEAVAQAVDISIVLYNIPGRTAVSLSPETFGRLAKIPNITSCKEASADMALLAKVMYYTEAKISMLSGDDGSALSFLGGGGRGVISVISNVDPRRTSAMVKAALAGDFAQAQSIQHQLNPLLNALTLQSNPIPVKAALEAMGMIEGRLRLPMTPLPGAMREALNEELRRLELLT